MRRCFSRIFFHTFLCVTFWILIGACTHETPEIKFGIQPGHGSYVPARISVLECRIWPSSAGFEDLPLSSVSHEAIAKLCEEFDRFVIDGFKNQPYMKGYTPKAVERLVEASLSSKESNKSSSFGEFMNQLPRLWHHLPQDCSRCSNEASFYSQSIADRKDWRIWLNTLSSHTRNSDAVLIPFLTYAAEKKYVDRGLHVSSREAGIALLLIDTNSGLLIWFGARRAVAPKKALLDSQHSDQDSTRHPQDDFPEWSLLEERLFTEDVWRQFPGRQIF